MKVMHLPECAVTPPTIGCAGCIATARPRTSTRRRRQQLIAVALDVGVHPATGRPVDPTHQCGDCTHCTVTRYAAAPTRFTCNLDRRGLRIRASMPACALWSGVLACTT